MRQILLRYTVLIPRRNKILDFMALHSNLGAWPSHVDIHEASRAGALDELATEPTCRLLV